jgi:hypothetical protein
VEFDLFGIRFEESVGCKGFVRYLLLFVAASLGSHQGSPNQQARDQAENQICDHKNLYHVILLLLGTLQTVGLAGPK